MNKLSETQIIPVVFATDKNYVPYCGVAISSLIENISTENIYKIYVLYDCLPQMSILRLESLSNESATVQCICIHDYVENLKVREYKHLTVATVYRLVIADVFSEYDKMVYLDSDIIVKEDIANLFNIDIGEQILGAVHGYYKSDDDLFLKHITQTLNIDKEKFFNAGILIINNKSFRKNKVKEKCFKLLEERNDLIYMDQCALNIVCQGKVYWISEKWNFEWLYLFRDKPIQIYDGEKPAIIHYDGLWKPWDKPDIIFAEYFWKYARKSIFYEEILKKCQINNNTKAICEVLGISGELKNIAVYGAGNIGRNYVAKVRELGICKIVAWVDQNYKNIKGTPIPVEQIERIYETNYDHVAIAIGDKKVAIEIEQMLIFNGVAEDKIIHITQ